MKRLFPDVLDIDTRPFVMLYYEGEKVAIVSTTSSRSLKRWSIDTRACLRVKAAIVMSMRAGRES